MPDEEILPLWDESVLYSSPDYSRSTFLGPWKAEKGPDGLFYAVPDHMSYPDYHPQYGNCRIERYTSGDRIFVPADGRKIPATGFDPGGWTTAYTNEEIKPERRNSVQEEWGNSIEECKIQKFVFNKEIRDARDVEEVFYGRVVVMGHPTHSIRAAYDLLASCFGNHDVEWHIDRILFERDPKKMDSQQEIEVVAWAE